LTSALCTTGAGISILNQQNFDSLNLFGLDPFLILGLATAASGAVGWLLGPFLGNAVFGIVWRRLRLQIAAVSFIFLSGVLS
jgi:import inner membrane translocase subunit TIM23